ncbi:HprK-related kinase A [Catenovulum sediminis]|uniref:HprK-related kinase A n=1 Tax=Catenovulum sediminis TaxID=1740262 RepID=UPI0011811E1E|nr:HprK-related kinase A [Catenovulum sediminis]
MRYINTGEYQFKLTHAPAAVFTTLEKMYGTAQSADTEKPVDFEISLKFDSLIRRFIKPQVTFFSGDTSPFKPLPISQSYPVLEWGMNWCIAAYEFNKLIIHAAVAVKNQQAIIFPATPGSGKSTLSAYLALSGWHLYSDEMAIIDPISITVSPLLRPVCLKNQSINLIKAWFSNASFSKTTHDTQKGSVAHLKVHTPNSYQNLHQANIKAIVFPKYDANKNILEIAELSKLEGFRKLSANAFNYNILALKAFNTVKQIIETTSQFNIAYNNLKDVNDFLTEDIIV